MTKRKLDDSIMHAIQENDFNEFVQFLGNNDEDKCANSVRQINDNNSSVGEQHKYHRFGDKTPFLLAAMYGRHEMLQYMLQIKNIDINQTDHNYINALSHIIIHRQTDNYNDAIKCAKLLTTHPLFSINSTDIYNCGALLLAAGRDDGYAFLQFFLRHNQIDL
jgi:hypothetical protein